MAELDQAKVDAFTQAMTGILNGGTLALMTSIGHQTGLMLLGDEGAEAADHRSPSVKRPYEKIR